MCDRTDPLRADLAEVDAGLEGALHRSAEAGHEVNVPGSRGTTVRWDETEWSIPLRRG